MFTVIGDTHGSRAAVKHGLAVAMDNGSDTLVSVGDFGFWPGPTGATFLRSVSKAAVSARVFIVVAPGNHDDYDFIEGLEYDVAGFAQAAANVQVAQRGAITMIGGVNVALMGGAHSIDGPGGTWRQVRGPGRGWWPRETISRQDLDVALDRLDRFRGDVDVLISHDAPTAAEWVTKKYPPNKATVQNRILLEAYRGCVGPKLCIWGHYHDVGSGPVGDGRGVMLQAADISRYGSMVAVNSNVEVYYPSGYLVFPPKVLT